MKKAFLALCSLAVFCLFGSVNAYYLQDNTLQVAQLKDQYSRLQKYIDDKFKAKINNLSTDDNEKLNQKLTNIKDDFVELDLKVRAKAKDARISAYDLKEDIRDLLVFLKNSKQKPATTKNQSMIQSGPSLDSFAGSAREGDMMYYSDSFEGSKTSNGNIFSQQFFSAAKCMTQLNKLVQINSGGKSLIVKVNDRPNCNRFPKLIDMTTTAFDFMFPRYKGTQDGTFIELGTAPTDYYKGYLDKKAFSDANITLISGIPNSYLKNESLHLTGESSVGGNIEMILTSPSFKKITLKKKVEKGFTFSIPLEEIGKYDVAFSGSDQHVSVYVLDESLFNGKNFDQSKKFQSLNSLSLIKEYAGDYHYAYRLALLGKDYHIAVIRIGGKTGYFSGIGDVMIPVGFFSSSERGQHADISISSAETITGFSHDFHTEPVVIFKGSARIPE